MAKKKPTPRRDADTRARFEDVAFMARHGATANEAAERLGLSVKTLSKSIDRHAAWPLWRQLVANERIRFGGVTEGEVDRARKHRDRMTRTRWGAAA